MENDRTGAVINEYSITSAESAKPIPAAFADNEYIVPVDPMDDLQCDSCQ